MLWNKKAMHVRQWTIAICLAAATLQAAPASAQSDMLQLDPVASEYTIGRFKYQVPKVDGWRQIANNKETLSLIYAEQREEDKIETLFGVTLEAHDIPPDANVTDARQLAELSRTQISEQRTKDMVRAEEIKPVPSIENFYTYRILVHAPFPEMPDAYEVYFVGIAPDKKQYIVIQCVTKAADYENSLYFTQFYGSLASIKYVPDASAPTATPPAPAAVPAAPATPPAPATAPAAPPAPAATPPPAH